MSGITDILDGLFARLTDTQSDFGNEFDTNSRYLFRTRNIKKNI